MFSKMGETECSTHFVVGDFVDNKLVNVSVQRPEWGRDFYAPQTFFDGKRRILIGWMYHWGKKAPALCPYAGALSIPRELTLIDDRVFNFPVDEARELMSKQSKFVHLSSNEIIVSQRGSKKRRFKLDDISSVDILEDTKSVEIFVNNGAISITEWLI